MKLIVQFLFDNLLIILFSLGLLCLIIAVVFFRAVDRAAERKYQAMSHDLDLERKRLAEFGDSLDDKARHIDSIISDFEKNLQVQYKELETNLRTEYANKVISLASATDIVKLFPENLASWYSLTQYERTRNRLFSAVSGTLSLQKPFQCSATIVGSSGNLYTTSLTSCTCEDFRRHGGPCKHMLFLALSLGCSAYQDNKTAFSQLQELQQQTSAFSAIKKSAENAKKKC